MALTIIARSWKQGEFELGQPIARYSQVSFEQDLRNLNLCRGKLRKADVYFASRRCAERNGSFVRKGDFASARQKPKNMLG